MSPFDRKTGDAGFTLLEVMITVAIVGILAAIALPSYSDYVMRSKIIDGTVKLGDMRAQMEKYFLDNRTYVGGCAATTPPVAGSDAFTVGCLGGSETATAYILRAVGDSTKGMGGFEYRVNQQGAKSTFSTAWGTTAANCWTVRKDGTCQ